MKFLCDVHISYKLTKYLESLGYESIHVNEILEKWHTADNQICDYADKNDFIVITKDSDFRNSFYINKTPKKLIKFNLGNISNIQMIDVLSKNLAAIEKLDKNHFFIVEISLESVQFNSFNNK